ncbi:hypothetical protein CROQUDRAFT_100741 [Cronartium quercuum f. sp. fusiforme G11]|uniref:Uncharacterized protein n=1 Tax=Cronartium quercuum f. sp. fusiforme G11 TaxID=708437 RepID=A0A9P6T722_9BASI|nr:hypothetical protein CROQUDRAFT_100741 [Cronartium quercuum f. sp. fusiforme G11]
MALVKGHVQPSANSGPPTSPTEGFSVAQPTQGLGLDLNPTNMPIPEWSGGEGSGLEGGISSDQSGELFTAALGAIHGLTRTHHPSPSSSDSHAVLGGSLTTSFKSAVWSVVPNSMIACS